MAPNVGADNNAVNDNNDGDANNAGIVNIEIR
jgi:hypothetical protein